MAPAAEQRGGDRSRAPAPEKSQSKFDRGFLDGSGNLCPHVVKSGAVVGTREGLESLLSPHSPVSREFFLHNESSQNMERTVRALAGEQTQTRRAARLEDRPPAQHRRFSRRRTCPLGSWTRPILLPRTRLASRLVLLSLRRASADGDLCLPQGLWLGAHRASPWWSRACSGFARPGGCGAPPFPESPSPRVPSPDRCDQTTKSSAPHFPEAPRGVAPLARGDPSPTTGLSIPSSRSFPPSPVDHV